MRKILPVTLLIILIFCSGCRGNYEIGKQTLQTEEGPVHYDLKIVTFNSGPSLGIRKLFTRIQAYLYIEKNNKVKKFKLPIFDDGGGGWSFLISKNPRDWCYMEKTDEKGIYRLYIGFTLRESVFIVDLNNDKITETDELHYAVTRNDIDAVKKFLETENVNKVMFTKNTAIHRAAYKGFSEVAELLLKKGADLEKYNSVGLTPLHAAAANNNTEVTTILIKYGAHVDVLTATMGMTSLHIGVQARHFEICEVLLKKGANPNIKDEKGRTPLDIAIAERKNHEGDIRRQGEYDKIIELLIKYGGKHGE